jgi:hypothetical protein
VTLTATASLLPAGAKSVGARPAKLTASHPTPEEKFGTSVLVTDDTMVVGAPDENGAAAGQGAVYVFRRVGRGSWSESARLVASDGAQDDKFGYSVALSGDTLVVGAPTNGGPRAGAGSAYVFTRTGETWVEEAKLKASDGIPADMFGAGVAASGASVLVGAFQAGSGVDVWRGAGYVFVRRGTTWIEQAKLSAADGAAGETAAGAVALSGDTAVISASWDTVGVNAHQGSVSVFTRTGETWSEQAELTASDGGPSEEFGSDLSLSGDSIVIGAFFDDIGLNAKQGSAYVFVRRDGVWSEEAKLLAPDGKAVDVFGRSVAINGDAIVVGAQWDDADGAIDPNDNRGSVYVFRRAGGTWTEQAKLTAPDGASGDLFGVMVGMSTDTVVVGASFADVGGITDQGAAYVFSDVLRRSPTTFRTR